MNRGNNVRIISELFFILILITLIINYISIYIIFFVLKIPAKGEAIFYFIYIPILAFGFIITPIQTTFWIIILTLIITAVLVFIFRDFFKFLKNKDYDRPLALSEGLLIIISFTLLSYYLSLIFTGNSQPFGNPVSSTPQNDLIVELLQAPVWEEFAYRSILIGIPLYIYYMIKGYNIQKYRMITGGNYSLNIPSIILILISSFFFGYAHTASWSIYKVPSAMFAGIVLGIIFVRYGIYMSIAAHFFIDFSGVLSYYPSPLNYAFDIYLGILYIIMTVFGLFYIVYYLIYPFINMKNKNINGNKKTSENNYMSQNFIIICPYCGYDKHEILPDGTFRCLKCGGIFRIEFSGKPPETVKEYGGNEYKK
ncbi:MAG: CPBP family glutamic-type intramembrane protease [Thermoplasmata archaeon]